MPALLLCVAVGSVATVLVNPDPSQSLKTAIASVAGIGNLYLFHAASDYFSSSTKLNSFTHTWSLGIEEQFYVFYPVLFWMFTASKFRQHRYWFEAVLGGACLASLICFIVFQAQHSVAVFYLLPFRFWELGLGCLIARARQPRIGSTRPVAPVAAGLLGICLLLPERFIMPATILAVMSTGCIIHWGGRLSLIDRALSLPKMRFIGKISYSLYLWHWPVLVLSRWTVGIQWWTVPFQIAAMIGLATLSQRYIETPWRKGSVGERPGPVIWAGLVSSAALIAAVAVLAVPLKDKFFMGQHAPLSQRGPQSLNQPYSMAGFGEWRGSACIYQSDADAARPIDPASCTLGARSAQHRMLVIGNSYSAAFVRGFTSLVRDHGFALTLVSSWGASPTPSVPNYRPQAKANAALWHDVYPALEKSLKTGDVVVLLSDLIDLMPGGINPHPDQAVALMKSDLERMGDRFRRRGVKLVVVDSLPLVRDYNCAPDAAFKQWYAPSGGTCVFEHRKYHFARRQAVSDMLRSLHSRGLLYRVDLFSVFCPDEICSYSTRKVSALYRDEYSHPSVEAMPAVDRAFVLNFQKAGLIR